MSFRGPLLGQSVIVFLNRLISFLIGFNNCCSINHALTSIFFLYITLKVLKLLGMLP